MSEKTIETLELEIETHKVEELAMNAETKLANRLASRWEARQYLFDGPVTFASVNACIASLDHWRRLDYNRPVKEMTIIFNGTSGIIQSLALYDFIRWLKLDGFTVNIEVAGRAHGQSAIIVAAGSKRRMTASSWLQIDEVGTGVRGSTFDAECELAWKKRLEAQMRRLLADGAKVTTRKIGSNLRLKGWNLDGAAAVAAGLVDEVSTGFPENHRYPVGWRFDDIPAAQNPKQRLSVAAIRKMRAESALLELENWDEITAAPRAGVVRFFNTVNTQTVGQAKIDLEAAVRLSARDITLMINSNGGSVTDGLGFIDKARQVNASGRVLNTEVLGYAASMGGVMLQCGKKRTMGREAWLLIHRVSSWFGDTTSQAQLSYDYCMQLQHQCFSILAERSVFTAEQVLEKCRDHDWWLSADEALKYGFIDEIR